MSHQEALLTLIALKRNLATLPEKVKNRLCTLSPGQNRPLSKVAFLCPSKFINTGLLRIVFIMAGCFRQPKGWSFLDDSANLTQSASNVFALILGGLKSNPGENAMRAYTQNLTKLTLNVKLTSLFDLVKPTPQGNFILLKNLTFDQASGLIKQMPGTRVKFSKMEEIA